MNYNFRLVVDTDIVVSAALKPTLRPDDLQCTTFLLAITRPARLYVSQGILAEYRDVLSRPELAIRKGLRQQLLDLIRKRAHLVHPARTVRIADDPEDDKFIECADAARADYLVMGNLRHFPRFWKNTKVVTSREFLSLVTPHLTAQSCQPVSPSFLRVLCAPASVLSVFKLLSFCRLSAGGP